MGRVTLKIVQKYEARQDGKRNVRLRITADRISRYVATNIDVAASSFNPKAKRENLNWIKPAHPNSAVYNETLRKLWDQAQAALDAAGPGATADQIQKVLEPIAAAGAPDTAPIPQTGFLAYAEVYINRRGESTTTDTYVRAIRQFGLFLASTFPDQTDVPFSSLTVGVLKEWRAWLQQKHTGNTPWLYHLRIKTLALEAAEDTGDASAQICAQQFQRVKIAKKRTVKQRLYAEEIERFSALDLPWGKPLRRTRDICLLMYYAHGMRVGDALRLRASNYVVIDGPSGEAQHRLIYVMGKTKKAKNVLLPPVAVDLLAPYRLECSSPAAPIFPFLAKVLDAGFTPYRTSQKVISVVSNLRVRLQDLTKKAEIDKAISPHTFRHSFADFARRSGLPVTRIKDALGHDQISTTQIYMDDLDQLSVDEVQDLFSRTTVGQQS